MSNALSDIAYSGHTIEYNGVQFGGSDSKFRTIRPPQIGVVGQYVYDDAHRVITHVKYTMTVQAVVHAVNPIVGAAQFDEIRRRLSVAGANIKISGIGLFGASKTRRDILWGPKPLHCSFEPVAGFSTYEMVWVVEFNVSECKTENYRSVLMAANYAVTWSYDTEGLGERRIEGYIQIPNFREGAGTQATKFIPDDMRDSIACEVPVYYRRVAQTYPESPDKTRLNFAFVDQELKGAAPPANVTVAGGDITFDSEGPGFTKHSVSMNVMYTTAKNVAPEEGGILALRAFVDKQSSMTKAIKAAGGENAGAVIPRRITIRAGLYDDNRVTAASFQWVVTKCLNAAITASGLWAPAPGYDWSQWSSSMVRNGCWTSKGVQGYTSSAKSDTRVTICAGQSYYDVGQYEGRPKEIPSRDPRLNYVRPDITEENSWLGYDVQVQVVRKEPVAENKAAVSYLPALASIASGGSRSPGTVTFLKSLFTDEIPTNQPSYSQDEGDVEYEYNGKPTTLVALQYKLMRVRYLPDAPKLAKIDGKDARLVGGKMNAPRQVFDILGWPVYYASGILLYAVEGSVDKLKKSGSPLSCADPDAITDGNY